MGKFPIPKGKSELPDSVEALYGQLRVSDETVSSLWSHQADSIRAYQALGDTPSDVAIELPTGAGKTLVGLLIAEWRRRRASDRVAFLCPTRQLAEQACAKASGYGIPAVLLTGPSAEWDRSDQRSFSNGSAVGISTYHHIFNSNSSLSGCDTLVFDDAHAAEGPISSAWTISVKRAERELYFAILTPLLDHLPGNFADAVQDAVLDPRRRREIELVLPNRVERASSAIRKALAEVSTRADNPRSYFPTSLVGENISKCIAVVSYDEIALRPGVCPTHELPSFSEVNQRIYMSATLGSSGELERTFGVPTIQRVEAPEGWTDYGSGRRLVLVAEEQQDGESLISSALNVSPKAIVVAPSQRQLDEFVAREVPTNARRFSTSELDDFVVADDGVLQLGNRYDGIDLPNDVCRVIALTGLPYRTSLFERAVSERLGARSVLSERIRTRLVQGMGRCTRNRHDYSLVLLYGDDLLEFVSREPQVAAMRPELQAEIRLALDYSEDSELDMDDLVRAFLGQTEDFEDLEAFLKEQATQLKVREDQSSNCLENSAKFEVKSWKAAWRGDFEKASEFAQSAAAELEPGGPDLAAWRALWLALAAEWLERDSSGGAEAVLKLRRAARGAASMTPWMPSFCEEEQEVIVGDEFQARAEGVIRTIRRLGVRGNRFENWLVELTESLSGIEATKYELGLRDLGLLLGFDSERPNDEADPDVAWRDADRARIIFEAKTEEDPRNPLSADDVRQAETHTRWVERQLGWEESDETVVAIVCPKTDVHEAAARISGVQVLVHPDVIAGVCERATTMAREVRGFLRDGADSDAIDIVSKKLTELALTTGDLVEELSKNLISDFAA